MPRFFFHIKDGETLHDDVGQELLNLEAVKKVALKVGAEVIGSMGGSKFWHGEPWRLWVTNQAGGEGLTLLTLQFQGATTREADG
jgi:hypothetical protein